MLGLPLLIPGLITTVLLLIAHSHATSSNGITMLLTSSRNFILLSALYDCSQVVVISLTLSTPTCSKVLWSS